MLLQWAERLLEGGGNEQWGDKWEERFKDGKGGKQVITSPCSRACSPPMLHDIQLHRCKFLHDMLSVCGSSGASQEQFP